VRWDGEWVLKRVQYAHLLDLNQLRRQQCLAGGLRFLRGRRLRRSDDDHDVYSEYHRCTRDNEPDFPDAAYVRRELAIFADVCGSRCWSSDYFCRRSGYEFYICSTQYWRADVLAVSHYELTP
jgi:hypothetical protein